MIHVRDDMRYLFPEQSVDEFFAIDGETIKHVVASRRIFRFQRGGKWFYMKVHFGVGWGEIIKNLLQLKLPVLGAEQEWQAIQAFGRAGVHIPTTPLVAWGKSGWNPARQHSFIITEALDNTDDLEHWLVYLQQQPDRQQAIHLKRAVLAEVAGIAHRLHDNGMNHRDFYLVHFRLVVGSNGLPLPGELRLHLMDLHRVQIRDRVPHRWRVKDIAGLLFSALYDADGLNVTRGDILRFVEIYTGMPWREALVARKELWRDVIQRIRRTYQHDHGNLPVLPRWIETMTAQDNE